jgi:DNA-binding FadR family transcriptional regulator
MLDLKQINVPKAAEVLAEILREKILGGDLDEGADLPNERALGEKAGLSRSTVREALRILESEGLIATRAGRNGGSAVVRPTAAGIERSVNIFIRGQRIRFEAVLETRGAIEPASARYAAQHRTEDDLAVIERSQAAMERASRAGDVEGYVKANLEWHVAVVRASHNELLIAFISAVAQAVYASTGLDGNNPVETREAVMRAHRRVIDAIRDRDGESAERRMKRHVVAYIANVHRNTVPAAGARHGAAPHHEEQQ